MSTQTGMNSVSSDWIRMWFEQNFNCIQNDMRNISEPEEIREYLFGIVQTAYNFARNKEKEAAKQRQADGIRAALENGIHFGRTKMEIPAEFYQLYFRYKKGELSARKCGEKLNVSHSTFLKWIKEIDESV